MHKRTRTYDEATVIHTTEKIGPKRARTPEGFLLCYDVAIARSGFMNYHGSEVPVKPDGAGVVRITRDTYALFDSTTLASFNGKPVVDEHPRDDDGGVIFVDSKNWKQHTVGITLNPRPGSGENSDCIVADLLITDAKTIDAIESGKREVSAGYEAEYLQTAPGHGRQTNIMGNHIALVERGRCGPRCAIGDHSHAKEHAMPATKKRVALDDDDVEARVRKTFKDAEEAAVAALTGDGNGPAQRDDVHIHLHTGPRRHVGDGDGPDDEDDDDDDDGDKGAKKVKKDKTGDDAADKRITALEAGQTQVLDSLTKLTNAVTALTTAKTGDGGDDIKTTDGMPDEVAAAKTCTVGDSAALATSFAAVVADAEVLVPGFRLPTFEPASPRKATMDSMCSMRRAVLNHVGLTSDGLNLLKTVSAGQTIDDKSTCYQVASLFRAAAGAKRLINNAAGARTGDGKQAQQDPAAFRIDERGQPVGKIRNLADLNKMHESIYRGQVATSDNYTGQLRH